MKPLRIVALASGRGSNVRVILDRIADGTCAAEVVAVISDRPAAPVLDLARERGLATETVLPKAFASRDDWDRALAERIAAFEPELVVLAGFMRIVGEHVLTVAPGRIVNVHPALLPSFPGAHGPADAIAKGVRISGCTVHVVDGGVDTGPILAQAAVAVLPSDDADTLHARIQATEHRLLPAVIDSIARGLLVLGDPPRWVGPLPEPSAALYAPIPA